jgi:hypothetical protein
MNPMPLNRAVLTDDRIFYGPYPCERCDKTIVKASRQQGGEEFNYPDGPIYPNTEWKRHDCSGEKASVAPSPQENAGT